MMMKLPQFASTLSFNTFRPAPPLIACLDAPRCLMPSRQSAQKYRYSFRLRLEKMMAPNMSES